MILRPRALLAEPSTWLAALICCGLFALAWFGYRAADQWQRSAGLLADHRGREAADLLARALTRDMSGVQTSILSSPEQNRYAFDPPYEANDLVALAFARYPYPEFFFGWTPSSGGTVMFARTDRLPSWITPRQGSDVYPVEVRRDPAEIAALRKRIESDIAGRRRYSVFDTSIGGVPYQVVALLAYEDMARERLDRVFGVAVNLEWARAHYFNDILRQVAQIAGNTSATSFAILDERGLRVAGTLEPGSQHTAATRAFPVLFFDPTLVAVDPPEDLAQRSWTVATSAAGDPTFALAARGARRSLVVVGAGVALLALSLIATARAARASAAVAMVRADFVATVTHELKTPLSTIRAIGETLVRGRVKTDEDLNRYAHLLVREERRLTRLVNNLLAYSRVTDVTEVYSFESVEPAALVSEAAQGFRRQLTESEVRIETDVAPDVPAVRADRTAIVLALDNLIDNAIRYSGEAKTVSVRASDDAGNVRFDVVDQGVGIPADDLPQVRRRFVRGRTARGPGNGLGLAIVNRIAADHGGALEITSEVGHGTTATLIIPKAAPECGQES
jgi:two-component system, OmpR family, phosphate regulon sensor histidine kinase PhoR